MRRPSTVELMLLATVLLWALNLSVTKYILTHGLAPLPYATVRYALAGLLFVALTLYVERTLRVERRHLPILGLAAALLFVNQLSFVFALDVTTASTIGLVLGAIPIFAAIFGLVLGTETPTRRFWLAAAISAAGVALVAAGSGGEVSGGLLGVLLGLATAATWAAYSVDRRPAHALVLAVADERDRDPRRLGRDRARRAAPRPPTRSGISAGRSGRSSPSRRSARSSSRTSSGSARSTASGPTARPLRPTCSRSSPPSSRSSCSRSRWPGSRSPAAC